MGGISAHGRGLLRGGASGISSGFLSATSGGIPSGRRSLPLWPPRVQRWAVKLSRDSSWAFQMPQCRSRRRTPSLRLARPVGGAAAPGTHRWASECPRAALASFAPFPSVFLSLPLSPHSSPFLSPSPSFSIGTSSLGLGQRPSSSCHLGPVMSSTPDRPSVLKMTVKPHAATPLGEVSFSNSLLSQEGWCPQSQGSCFGGDEGSCEAEVG